jgi:fatty acid desaturase
MDHNSQITKNWADASPPLSKIGTSRGWIDAVEWPTVSLCGIIYLGWMGVTVWHEPVPGWALFLLGGLVTAWHASFQHEATHGHPTRSPRLNAVLAGPALLLWLPFGMFRRDHLRHHAVDVLTDPLDDPESFYVLESTWRRMNQIRRALLMMNNTLAGRMLIGPILVVGGLAWRQSWLLCRGDRQAIRDWLLHLPWLVLVLGWLVLVAEIPIWLYVLCFSYPGTALLLLRSYIEHRPHTRQATRTVIVEAGPLLSLLFLNNNLHALHHSRPALPWYRLPAAYHHQRAHVLAENGGFRFAGYGEIARRFLFRAKDHPMHPTRWN